MKNILHDDDDDDAYSNFELAYFKAYAKQLVQINIPLCIIYKLVNVVYENTVYEGIIFVSKKLWIKIKTYLFT